MNIRSLKYKDHVFSIVEHTDRIDFKKHFHLEAKRADDPWAIPMRTLFLFEDDVEKVQEGSNRITFTNSNGDTYALKGGSWRMLNYCYVVCFLPGSATYVKNRTCTEAFDLEDRQVLLDFFKEQLKNYMIVEKFRV